MRAFLAKPLPWIITSAVILVLAVVAVWWFGFARPDRASTQAFGLTQTTRTVTVGTQTLQQTIEGTGTLDPVVDESFGFGTSGTVTAVKVKAGQTVKKGQTLATLDTLSADASLASAKAQLASAEAKLADAESSSKGTSADEASITAAESAVSVAQASVTSAEDAVDATTLTAPVSGLLVTVGVAVGDTVSGGSSSSGSSGGSGSAAGGSSGASGSSSSSSSSDFEIIGTSKWQLSVSVAAASVKNVKAGDQVTLSTTENTSFFGTVSSVGLLPATSSGAATYPVVVVVTGSPDDLYDGVTVTAEIVYKKTADAVAVPSEAITTSNGASTVEKVVDGKTTTTTVKTGISSGGYTQITSGLASGDSIQVRGITRVSTGGSTSGTRTGTGTGLGGTGTGFGGAGGFGGSGFGPGTAPGGGN